MQDDLGTRRMKTILVLTGTVHLYIMHPLSQPDIIEEPIFSLEYNVVRSNDKYEDVNYGQESNVEFNCVEEGNVELRKSNVEKEVKNEELNLKEGVSTMLEDIVVDEDSENEGTTMLEDSFGRDQMVK